MLQQQLRRIELDEDDRRSGLGGSDSPVVLGVSPFKTRKELWREKIGVDPPKEINSPAIKRGNSLESIVADLYAEVKGRKVEVVKQKLHHPLFHHIYAHIDRRIIDDKKAGPGVLEIKCPGAAVFGKCKREGLQPYYIIQLQHYLGVTGMKWGAFAVFSAEYWEIIEFDVFPDQELIRMIIQEDNKFWNQVLAKEEPQEPEIKAEIDEKMESLSVSEIANMEKINPDLWAELVTRYHEAKMLKEEGEANLDLYESKIKEEMARVNAKMAEGAGARIYWKEQKGKLGLNKSLFEAERPDEFKIYQSYLAAGKPSRPFRAFFPRPIMKE